MNQLIPRDFCDNDLYKFSMGQLFFNQFPRLQGKWEYINRTPNQTFPKDIDRMIWEQCVGMKDLRLSDDMFVYLTNACPWLKPSYLQWLKSFRYNADNIEVYLKDGKLVLNYSGPVFEHIFWEVPLLFIISELMTKNETKVTDWKTRITKKSLALANAGVNWIDFGTRRRFDFETQEAVVALCRAFAPNFRGTSNPYLASKFNVKSFGTYAHEFIMAMQGVYGVCSANLKAMEHWTQEFRGDLGIALTDTYTTKVFLRDFDMFYAKLFDGWRLDSGDMKQENLRVLAHLKHLGIDTRSKLAVPSNQLNVESAIDFHNTFKEHCKVTCGIGTYFTNDVGPKAPDHVIKLIAVDNGYGWQPVVKLSDSRGKYTGDPEAISNVKLALQI